MIFQHTIDKVLSGEKTQTRRIVKPGDVRVCVEMPFGGWQPVKITGIGKYNQPIIRWEIGKTYAVQGGRKHKARGRIRVTDLRIEDVRNISEADVKAEGFRDRFHFMQTWTAMHDKCFQLDYYDGIIWQFKGVGDSNCYSEYPRDEFVVGDFKKALWSRPAERYQAWVLTFELVNP